MGEARTSQLLHGRRSLPSDLFHKRAPYRSNLYPGRGHGGWRISNPGHLEAPRHIRNLSHRLPTRQTRWSLSVDPSYRVVLSAWLILEICGYALRKSTLQVWPTHQYVMA